MRLLDAVKRLLGIRDEKFETHWGFELQEDVYAVGGRRPRMPRLPARVVDHEVTLPVSPRPDVLGEMKLTVHRADAHPKVSE